MAYGVDTAVHRVQLMATDPPTDLTLTDSCVEELALRGDAVLAGRQLCDHSMLAETQPSE